MKYLQEIFKFIEKHHKFVKKLVLFFLFYFTMLLVNKTELIPVFNQFFGEYVTMTIQPLLATFMLGGE